MQRLHGAISSVLRHTLRKRDEQRASDAFQARQATNTAERLDRQRDKQRVAADVQALDANRRDRCCRMQSDDFGTQPNRNVIIFNS